MMALPEQWRGLNVALAHDWLTGMRGGERVLEVLCRAFPGAPIYTLLASPAAVSETIRGRMLHTSWLQRIPGITASYRYFLPLFPGAIERLRVAGADLLISTSHCVAKGIRPPAGARHLCYCFTPMRYAWVFYDEYFGRNPVKRALMTPLLKRLRTWDRQTCARVDRFVALSRHVQERIRRFYDRDADVVYPPVNVDFWTPDPVARPGAVRGGDLGAYDLVVSALVPYKRIDLAVRAYTRLGFPLKIAGAGTELARLRRQAGRNIEFVGCVPDMRVRELYRGCRFLVFPGKEDFGLVPVEAQACGRPVLAFGEGGALESIREGVTGVFFREATTAALLAAVETGAARPWDPAAIQAHAARFSEANFIQGLAVSVEKCLAEKR